MKQFLLALVSDDRGIVSTGRFLNVMVGVCACLISWKLVVFKEYSPEYFFALLAYGAGTYGWGKALDVKQSTTEKQNG
jgi:hypothetical protein